MFNRFERFTVFKPPALPEVSDFKTRHPFDNGEMLIRDELLEAHPRRPEAVRQHIADYCAIIGHLDEQIGGLLGALEETGKRTTPSSFSQGTTAWRSASTG